MLESILVYIYRQVVQVILHFHIPHAHFPLLLTSYITMGHLSQLINQY